MKRLTFHTTSNKRQGRKLPSNLERTIITTELEKTYFLEKDGFYEFQQTAALTAWSMNAECFFVRKRLILLQFSTGKMLAWPTFSNKYFPISQHTFIISVNFCSLNISTAFVPWRLTFLSIVINSFHYWFEEVSSSCELFLHSREPLSLTSWEILFKCRTAEMFITLFHVFIFWQWLAG